MSRYVHDRVGRCVDTIQTSMPRGGSEVQRYRRWQAPGIWGLGGGLHADVALLENK
jgi:hypothetical protein